VTGGKAVKNGLSVSRENVWRRDHYKKNRDRFLVGLRRSGSAHVLRLKDQLIAAYGGKCSCCGEAHKDFLTIDHIGGGGCAKRRSLKISGANFYRHLKKLGWPKVKYRLLCMNCNFATRRGKQCPHEALEFDVLGIAC
jgi:hypothetical protein